MLRDIFATIVATIILLIVGFIIFKKIGLSFKPLAQLIPSADKLVEDTGVVFREGPKFLANAIFRGRKGDAGFITSEQQRQQAQEALATRRARSSKPVRLTPGFGR